MTSRVVVNVTFRFGGVTNMVASVFRSGPPFRRPIQKRPPESADLVCFAIKVDFVFCKNFHRPNDVLEAPAKVASDSLVQSFPYASDVSPSQFKNLLALLQKYCRKSHATPLHKAQVTYEIEIFVPTANAGLFDRQGFRFAVFKI